jgi:hypothetical protein
MNIRISRKNSRILRRIKTSRNEYDTEVRVFVAESRIADLEDYCDIVPTRHMYTRYTLHINSLVGLSVL